MEMIRSQFTCPGGGIGRHARFRFLCSQGCASSSLVPGTKSYTQLYTEVCNHVKALDKSRAFSRFSSTSVQPDTVESGSFGGVFDGISMQSLLAFSTVIAFFLYSS